jgi:hypothetical protein
MTVRTYDYLVSAQTYTVPVNCSEVTVTAWGGGSAAHSYEGGDGCDREYTGSEGAYGEWTLPVIAGDALSISVGRGGYTNGGNGSNTTISSHGKTVTAGAGGYYAGGNISTSWSGAVAKSASRSGAAGACVDNDDWLGGPTNGTLWGNYGQGCTWEWDRATPPIGAGGCNCDECTGDSDEWGWSYGGNGKVTVQCSKGMN